MWFTPEGYNTDKRKAGWTSPMHVLVQKQVYFQKCTNDLPWGRKTWPEGVLSFTQMFAACTAVTYSWNKTTEIQSDVTRSLNNIRLIADYVPGNHAKHLFCLSLWVLLLVTEKATCQQVTCKHVLPDQECLFQTLVPLSCSKWDNDLSVRLEPCHNRWTSCQRLSHFCCIISSLRLFYITSSVFSLSNTTKKHEFGLFYSRSKCT